MKSMQCLLVAGLLAVGATGVAQARDVYWSVGVGSPGVAVGVSNAPPVYVAPQPVYVAPPPPVYVRPPRPVYVAPPPVVYRRPPPVYYYDGYYYDDRPRRRHRHRHRHDD